MFSLQYCTCYLFFNVNKVSLGQYISQALTAVLNSIGIICYTATYIKIFSHSMYCKCANGLKCKLANTEI